MRDDFDFATGIRNGLLFSAGCWALLYAVIWMVTR